MSITAINSQTTNVDYTSDYASNQNAMTSIIGFTNKTTNITNTHNSNLINNQIPQKDGIISELTSNFSTSNNAKLQFEDGTKNDMLAIFESTLGKTKEEMKKLIFNL